MGKCMEVHTVIVPGVKGNFKDFREVSKQNIKVLPRATLTEAIKSHLKLALYR